MACFLVPAAEAVVATAASKTVAKKSDDAAREGTRLSFAKKLKWLSHMLWGGSVLLLFEHVWHGEIVPWFPFLTAMENPGDTVEMLHEMATVGSAMALVVTGVWVVMVLVTNAMEKKALQGGAAI